MNSYLRGDKSEVLIFAFIYNNRNVIEKESIKFNFDIFAII